MPELSGSETLQNLTRAFTRESETNRRYLWFAQQADVEGRPDAAALFRSIADGETGHAHGLMEYLADVGDPITGQAIGDTVDNLRAAISAERHESAELYPGFAEVARREGFGDIADWFETLGIAERSHAERLESGLEQLG